MEEKTFTGFDRGDAAALRRGTDPWEVKGFYDLIKAYPARNKVFLAMTAPLIAEVRENSNESLGKLAKSKLSEPRLRRLLSVRDREDLVHQLRSVTRILDRQVNIIELVDIVNFWGEARRRQIAEDYFS